MDSDDYLEANAVELLVKEMEDADVVISAYNKISHINGSLKVESIYSVLNGIFRKDKFFSIFGQIMIGELFHYVWNKLYRSHILKKSVRFNEELNISEDLDFNIRYFENVTNAKVTNYAVYNHILYNNASITRNYISDLFFVRKSVHLSLVDLLKRNNSFSEYNKSVVQKLYARRIIGCFYNLVRAGRRLSIPKKMNIIKIIVTDESTREIISSFSKYKFMGSLIEHKMVVTIYLLHTIKYHFNKLKKALKR